MLTDECGKAGHSIRTTEVTDWKEVKCPWRHLCGENTFSASKKVNSRRKKPAPRDAVLAVGVRSVTTVPYQGRGRIGWSKTMHH